MLIIYFFLNILLIQPSLPLNCEIVFVFIMFLGQTQWRSRLIPYSVLRDKSWRDKKTIWNASIKHGLTICIPSVLPTVYHPSLEAVKFLKSWLIPTCLLYLQSVKCNFSCQINKINIHTIDSKLFIMNIRHQIKITYLCMHFWIHKFKALIKGYYFFEMLEPCLNLFVMGTLTLK